MAPFVSLQEESSTCSLRPLVSEDPFQISLVRPGREAEVVRLLKKGGKGGGPGVARDRTFSLWFSEENHAC